jgi:hypothetical protein
MAGYYAGLGKAEWRTPQARGIYDAFGRLVSAWRAERGNEPFEVRYEGATYEAYLVGADGVPFRKLQP